MTARARRLFVSVTPLGAVLVASILAALTERTSPARIHLERAWLSPSRAFPLGTGEGGIDLLRFAAAATARVLVLALAVSAVGFVVGTVLGTASGLVGGRRGRAVLRACDLVQAFPTFLLALAVLAATRTPTRLHIGAVFCLSAWAPFARLSLVQARALAGAQFLEAARAIGASPPRILARHVIPNVLAPVSVQLGTSAAGVVLGETSLAFVGLGPSDGITLGALLEQGTLSMLCAPHVLLVAAASVALVSGSLQLASEGLRAALGGERALD